MRTGAEICAAPLRARFLRRCEVISNKRVVLIERIRVTGLELQV